MDLTIETRSFGPLKIMMARPFDLAIELTKIRYGRRTLLIGFQFGREIGNLGELGDWRLWDYVCEPVRGELSDALFREVRSTGEREIGAWIAANPDAIYRRQRYELIKRLPDFRAEMQQLIGDLLGRDLPWLGLELEQRLREVLDSTPTETLAAA